jgi:hypothetical protein
VACSTSSYDLPSVQAVEPAELEAGEEGEIVIRGSDFANLITNDLSSGETQVDSDYRVLLTHSSGEVLPIELGEVLYLDENSLRALVPGSSPSGTYSVQVIGPLGEGLPSADVFRVKALADAAFSEPVRVPGVSSNDFNDDDPTLTADLLEMYFKSTRGPQLDIFRSTRNSPSDSWSTPARVDELSSSSVDNTPEVSADGLTIYLASNRDGNIDQYRSTRASRSDSWSQPLRVDELASDDADFSATTDSTGLHLVMNRFSTAATDLYSAERESIDDAWSTPAFLAELNTDRYEADAVLDPSGLRLLYTLEEATPGQGRQIYGSERNTLRGAFGESRPLMTINTEEDDEDPWISPDLSVIYFSRTTASGRKDIYMAERPAP